MKILYRTPDRDSHCFFRCEIYLPHIPAQARGKDKKQTTAGRPHAGPMLIGDVIVIIKLCHHVASQRIQDFLELFFMLFQY